MKIIKVMDKISDLGFEVDGPIYKHKVDSLRDELIKKHGRIKIYQLSELLQVQNLERLPHDNHNSTCKH